MISLIPSRLLLVLVLATAPLVKAQNTFIKLATDASASGGKVLVDGHEADLYAADGNIRPLATIPPTGHVLVQMGDNNVHRVSIVVTRQSNGVKRRMLGTVVEAFANRDRPNDIRAPGPQPPRNPSRVENLSEELKVTEDEGWLEMVILGGIVGLILASLGWLIARELRRPGGNGRIEASQTIHGWPHALVLLQPRLVPEGKIASGGMGTIYIARNVRARKRRAAVKVLHPQLSDADNPEALRFLDEARLLKQIGGLGLAPQLYSMTDERPGPHATLWFEMELLDGWQTLRRHIGGRERRALPPEQAMRLLRLLVNLVSRLHLHKVLHRDLSPENVMIDMPSMEMRLVDFGLAKWTGQTFRDSETRSAHLTQPGEHVGKPRYCAPEQWLEGLAAAGPAADWYSVGIMAFEMILGRPPYESPDQVRRSPVTGRTLMDRGVDAGMAGYLAQLVGPSERGRLEAAKHLIATFKGG